MFNLIINSILNKITPEKFKKLSKELLGVGLDSPAILKGVILLIFDKALEEPKYSSMYAQLCRIISEEAPNFETALNTGPLNTVSLSIRSVSQFKKVSKLSTQKITLKPVEFLILFNFCFCWTF